MTRTTLALALLVTVCSSSAQAQDHLHADPHVRSRHANLVGAVAAGVRTSETFQRIVDEIDKSDVVVYLDWRRPSSFTEAAHVSFVSAAGGRRYLLVAIDPRYAGCQLLALLGHELRHAVEIAGEPSVVNAQSLAAFYGRIGFSVSDWESERYDSRAAIEAGWRVTREVLQGRPRASHAR